MNAERFLNFVYEALYSTRILFGVTIFAHFVLAARSRVALRSVFSYAAVIMIGACFSLLFAYIQENSDWTMSEFKILHGFWYSGLLFVLFGVIVFCYKGSFAEYVYSFTCGLLVECSVFGLFRLCMDFGVVALRVNTPFSVSLEYAFSALCYCGYYFLYRRIVRLSGKVCLEKRYLMTAYFIGIITLIMILRFNLQAVYEEVYSGDNSWIVSLTLGLIPVAFLALVTGSVRLDLLSREKDVLSGMLAEKERQYAMSAENIDIINRKCHDIKKQLRALEFLDENARRDSLSELHDAISIYETGVHTSSAAMNTLLAEKGLYCRAHGLRLTCIVDGDACAFIDPVDLYVMFGNVLDNAIEATEKLADKEKRGISMTVEKQCGFLCVRVDNYYADEPLFDGDLPRTSKSAKAYHGFGLRSIRYVAEKYGGSMRAEANNGVFTLLINLPLPA